MKQRLLLDLVVLIWAGVNRIAIGAPQEAADAGNAVETPTAPMVARWVDELTPVIEAVNGRKFTSKPKVALVDREQLEESLAKDVDWMLALLNPGQDELERQIEAGVIAMQSSPLFMGKYSFVEQRVLLASDNFARLVSKAGIDSEHSLMLLRLVLTHELTHALQDQHLDIKAYYRCLKGRDEVGTVGLMLEEHAVLSHERVADRMKLAREAEQLRTLLPGGVNEMLVVASDPLNRELRDRMAAAHQRTRDLLRSLCEPGSMDAIWRLFEQSISKRTAAATPGERLTGKCARLLEGIDKRLGEKWADVQTQEGGADLARSFFRSSSAAKKVLARIKHVQVCTCINRSDKGLMLASVIVYELNDENGSSFVDELRGAHATNLTIQSQITGLKARTMEVEKLSIGDPRSAEYRREILEKDGVAELEWMFSTAAKGCFVVQALAVNHVIGREKITEIFQDVLGRIVATENADRP